MLSSASDKAKLFAENFSKNSNLDDSVTSSPLFPSRKMVKKIITNLDLSKASGPDCIPVVALKNCEPELSYILAKLFNKCLNESLYLTILGKGLQLKTTPLLVFLLWLLKSSKNM